MKVFPECGFFNQIMPLSLLVALCAGCSAEMGGEFEQGDVAEIEQALGEGACGTAAAAATFNGTVDHQSPRTYSTPGCYKGFIVDVNNLNMQAPAGRHAALMVQYNDTPPTNQAACEKIWVAAYAYARFGGVWEKVELIVARGQWQPSSGCAGPLIQLDDGIFTPGRDDNSYRVVASARTDGTSAAPTRALRVFSDFRGNQP